MAPTPGPSAFTLTLRPPRALPRRRRLGPVAPEPALSWPRGPVPEPWGAGCSRGWAASQPPRAAPASVGVCRFLWEQGDPHRVLSEPGAQSEREARGRASWGFPAHCPQLALLLPTGPKPQDDLAPQQVLAAAPSDSAQNWPWPPHFLSTSLGPAAAISCLDQCSRHPVGPPALPSRPTAFSRLAPKSRQVPPLLRPLMMALSSVKATVHETASRVPRAPPSHRLPGQPPAPRCGSHTPRPPTPGQPGPSAWALSSQTLTSPPARPPPASETPGPVPRARAAVPAVLHRKRCFLLTHRIVDFSWFTARCLIAPLDCQLLSCLCPQGPAQCLARSGCSISAESMALQHSALGRQRERL